MKQCSICKEPKPLSEFNKNKAKKDGLATLCKTCNKLRSKAYYKRNHEKHIKDVRARNKIHAQRLQSYVMEWLSTHPCIDCGETNILTLEFAHRDRSLKDGNVGQHVHNGWGLERLKKEIDKCDVLCCNCHRKHTHQEDNSFRWQYYNTLQALK